MIIKVNNIDQILWPKHCVKESKGSDFPTTLNFKTINKIIYKGTNSQIDSYSGFYDNGKIHSTGLSDYLKTNNVENKIEEFGFNNVSAIDEEYYLQCQIILFFASLCFGIKFVYRKVLVFYLIILTSLKTKI